MSEETLIEFVTNARARLAEELAHGGTEEPCPFCKLPRCQRSDYIRCVRCGINWSPGEPLDMDPSVYRDQVRRDGYRAGRKEDLPAL